MDFIWNTSLKKVQVQFLAHKMPKKKVEIEPKEKNGLSTQECQSALP